MPKTVIVPLDGSDFGERALARAGAIARQADAELVVMTSSIGGVVVDPVNYLDDAAARTGAPDVETLVDREHHVWTALRHLCEERPDPVVCMSTHGRSGVGSALLGSAAEEVLRQIAAPVVVVGPTVDPTACAPFETLVVSVDATEHARSVLPIAAEWARALDLDVRLVAVEERGHTPSDEELAAVADQVVLGTDRAVAIELRRGNPAHEIVAAAFAEPHPLVAMATHARAGFARVAVGSVTMHVAHDAPCPVLVVRPGTLAAA